MKKYRTIFLMGMEQALEYRLSFFLSMLSAIFPIIIQLTMWTYIYGEVDGKQLFGYAKGEIILYSLLATIVSQFVSTGFEVEMNTDIKMGGLNKYLMKPVMYKWYHFYRFLGQKLPRATILFPAIGVILFVSMFQEGSFSFFRLLAFGVSLLFALILNFLIFFCIGLMGFWLTDVDKLFGTISIVLVVVSGGVFPLDIFGKVAEFFIRILPFGYTTQFSVNIVNGKLSLEQIGTGFLFQFSWMVVFMGVSEWMWKQGSKRYTAVGG